ncbi:MAG: hypothetical protein ABJA34_10970 [Pseudonocardiales bacterium]
MRASDVMGKRVHCHDGTVGTVIDLRLDTGLQPGQPATEVSDLRLDGLVVSPAHWGGTLGYDRRDQGRPWLLWRLVRWLHRNDRFVPWDLVDDWSGPVVQLDASLADLQEVPPLAAAPHGGDG